VKVTTVVVKLALQFFL